MHINVGIGGFITALGNPENFNYLKTIRNRHYNKQPHSCVSTVCRSNSHLTVKHIWLNINWEDFTNWLKFYDLIGWIIEIEWCLSWIIPIQNRQTHGCGTVCKSDSLYFFYNRPIQSYVSIQTPKFVSKEDSLDQISASSHHLCSVLSSGSYIIDWRFSWLYRFY